jgi:hypothetical protein
MRKRNRQNSVQSDCIGGEPASVLIRRSSSREDDSQRIPRGKSCTDVAFAGVAAASVPRDWTWSTF